MVQRVQWLLNRCNNATGLTGKKDCWISGVALPFVRLVCGIVKTLHHGRPEANRQSAVRRRLALLANAHCGNFAVRVARCGAPVAEELAVAKVDLGGESGDAESAPKMG